MNDQAEKLREIMKARMHYTNPHSPKNAAKVTTITSGKGGVGKTNFAINLAISIRRLGYRVLVIDADLGLANIEILTGTNIEYTITDLIIKGKRIQDIICDGPEGIKLLSGGTGLHNLTIMDERNIKKLLFEIEKLEYLADYIIIDTGAGISNKVIDFVLAASEVILITTPDPTSVMDGYTMIKALTSNGYRGKLNIVTNIVNNRKEAMDTFNKLDIASNNFLQTKIYFLGYLEKDNIISKAVKNQMPFLLTNPSSAPSKRMNIMALKFITNKSEEITENLSFTQKLKLRFLGRGGK